MQVFELRPSIMWDKGKALEFLLESLGTYAQHTHIHLHRQVITVVFGPSFLFNSLAFHTTVCIIK